MPRADMRGECVAWVSCLLIDVETIYATHEHIVNMYTAILDATSENLELPPHGIQPFNPHDAESEPPPCAACVRNACVCLCLQLGYTPPMAMQELHFP